MKKRHYAFALNQKTIASASVHLSVFRG